MDSTLLAATQTMAEQLGELTRTHTCGALRAGDVGAEAILLGWVHRIRDLGGVIFLDLRDRAGVSQVVVRENDALMKIAERLRPEYVVGIKGISISERNDVPGQNIRDFDIAANTKDVVGKIVT